MISFNCPHCGKRFAVSDHWAGKKAACKTCGNAMIIPEAPLQVLPAPGGEPTASRPGKIVVSFDASPGEAMTSHKPAKAGMTESHADTGVGQREAEAERPKERKLPMRVRRMLADADHMNKLFSNFPLIRVVSMEGSPPDRYRVQYHIRGIARGNDGQPVYRDMHLVEIQLTSDYPRQSPKCRILTPIFHPNFDPTIICVGDHWTAAERLTDLVVRIGEMIAYQTYNIKSPLDGEAAMWADLNQNAFPVDKRSLTPPES